MIAIPWRGRYASHVFRRDLLLELYQHMEWADATVWRAVPSSDGPPDDRLRLLLAHIHFVQRAFLHVWTDRPVADAFRPLEDFTTFAALRDWAQPYYAQASGFIQTLSEEALARPVVLPWAAEISEALGCMPQPASLAETCFQVSSHSTYHRGQVNTRLRDLGGEPPLVDYIAWVWFGKPQARWGA
jgi:uncharacterized damage-inducible protein DinB